MKNYEDIPGEGVIEQLASEWADPEILTAMAPMDLGYIRDNGVKAIVALATCCKWNVIRSNHRPIKLIARDGAKLDIPSDTTIRFSVFSQRAYAVARHSITVVITDSLVESIIKATKLGPSHAKVLRELPRMHRADEREVTPEEIIEVFKPEETATGDPVDETIVRVEPTFSQTTKGWGYESPLMDTVIRQLVPDGVEQISYRCKWCGLEFPSKRGVGGHYQIHIREDGAPDTSKMPRKFVKLEPTPEPVLVETEPDDPDWVIETGVTWEEPEPTPEVHVIVDGMDPDVTVNEIAKIVQALIDKAVIAATLDLKAEIDVLSAEVIRLRQERLALRDLLS